MKIATAPVQRKDFLGKECGQFGLTKRQRELLSFIKDYVSRSGGIAPKQCEMALALGSTSKSNIHDLLVGLEERGAIRRQFAKTRAIEVIVPSKAKWFRFDDVKKALVPLKAEAAS